MHSLADFNLHIPANALVFTVILALSCIKGKTSDFTTRDVPVSARDQLFS